MEILIEFFGLSQSPYVKQTEKPKPIKKDN